MSDQPKTNAERLAQAVLDGDIQAALLLADEVQLQFQQGKDFVPRSELLDTIRAWLALEDSVDRIARIDRNRTLRRVLRDLVARTNRALDEKKPTPGQG